MCSGQSRVPQSGQRDDPRSVLHRFYTVYRADGSRKLNNDLKELYAKEQEEIQVILARLSEETAQYIEEIRTDYRILTDLDLSLPAVHWHFL